MNTFTWLLKREYWEHRGGFYGAPFWVSTVMLALTLLGIILTEVVASRARVSTGIPWQQIASNLSSGDYAHAGAGLDVAYVAIAALLCIVLFFVVFFYLLGALYDDRRDRSVLFWKSLPVSDRDTVLSKVTSALVVAPAMAMAVGIACMIGFLLILSMFVLFHGGNPFTLLWSPSNLLANAGVAIAALPLYALWALPSVGWLLLCSVWARSKPFLWALAIPVFAGVFISWFDLMNAFDLNSGWFWKNVVAHLLGGVFPGTWMHVIDDGLLTRMPPTSHVAVLRAMYSVLGAWQLWVGVVAGIAMIAASIRLRRWRDDN